MQEGVSTSLFGKAKKTEKMKDEGWDELDVRATTWIRLEVARIMLDLETAEINLDEVRRTVHKEESHEHLARLETYRCTGYRQKNVHVNLNILILSI